MRRARRMKSNVYRNGQTAYIGNIRRTKFLKPIKTVTTTMTVGKLYPIRWEEVIPGSNWKSNVSFTCTLTSAYLRPVKDNLFMDVYSFAVPCRLLQDGWEEIFGSSSPSAYTQDELGEVCTTSKAQTVSYNTVAERLGLPLGPVPKGISILPLRAFALIWNEWFRNQNVDGEVLVQTGDTWSESTEGFNTNEWSPTNYTGKLPNVTRLKDYFSVAVPSPQKGVAVPVSFISGTAPVDVGPDVHNFTDDSLRLFASGGTLSANNVFPLQLAGDGDTGGELSVDVDQGTTASVGSLAITGSNMVVDGSSLAVGNVNDLRLAFALQRMQELDIFGGRYREYLKAHYNVDNGDARMQIPEFLGGRRTDLNNQTIAQTSQATTESPLGALAGYSDTANAHVAGFSKAFTEHTIIMTVACIRQRHTYQQGINVKWTRSKRADFYDPCFAHIGNQPIYQSELYGNVAALKGNVFGYKEAWSEYKQSFNEITGQARTGAPNSLDIYHFADYYSSAPVLGQQFIEETDEYFARTVAVEPSGQDPFIVDFAFNDTVVLPMPLNCDPGLIDHRG